MHGIQLMKRKHRPGLHIVREPNGRNSRDAKLEPVAEIKRIRDAAIADVRHSEWGTVCGMLFLNERITAELYEASKRWGRFEAANRSAICMLGQVRAINMESSHSHPPDPDSEEGRRIARRETRAREAFEEAHKALCSAGKLAELAVRDAVERNEYPVGTEGHEALNRGLTALATHWRLTNQRKSDVR